MFWNFYFSVYSLFKNEILGKTSFIIITDNFFLRKWISSPSHVLEALLLAPKLLRLGKSQGKTVGILPNKRSQLGRYCLVSGIRPVCGLTTVGQMKVKACFIGCKPVHRSSVFFSFMFMYDMKVPN